MTFQEITRQQSQSLPQTVNEIGTFISLLSHRISEVCSAPPLQELLNQGQKKGILEAIISLLILKAANRLSVSGNLRGGQADEIAQQIMTDYPLLSIEDINLLLLNGSKGKYGEIYRFDISVIYSWIKAYELEKAEYLEQNMVKVTKSNTLLLPEINNFDPSTSEMINNYLNKLATAGGMRKVPNVTEDELYQDKPKAKSAGIKYGSEHDNWIRDMKILWAKEHTDLYTGRLKKNAMDFETWLELRK